MQQLSPTHLHFPETGWSCDSCQMSMYTQLLYIFRNILLSITLMFHTKEECLLQTENKITNFYSAKRVTAINMRI